MGDEGNTPDSPRPSAFVLCHGLSLADFTKMKDVDLLRLGNDMPGFNNGDEHGVQFRSYRENSGFGSR